MSRFAVFAFVATFIVGCVATGERQVTPHLFDGGEVGYELYVDKEQYDSWKEKNGDNWEKDLVEVLHIENFYKYCKQGSYKIIEKKQNKNGSLSVFYKCL